MKTRVRAVLVRLPVLNSRRVLHGHWRMGADKWLSLLMTALHESPRTAVAG